MTASDFDVEARTRTRPGEWAAIGASGAACACRAGAAAAASTALACGMLTVPGCQSMDETVEAARDLASRPEAVATRPDDHVGHVLVSQASELTGKSQQCRNELFCLFGHWIPWADKSLPRAECEAQVFCVFVCAFVCDIRMQAHTHTHTHTHAPHIHTHTQDKSLRDTARELYVGELRRHGLTVTYNRFGNHSSSVTVAWSGLRMEREVTDVCACACVRVCVCACACVHTRI